MEPTYLAVLLCGISLFLCSAEYTADLVYDILSSKMDNVYFDIRNLRSDINEITEKDGVSGQFRYVEECTELKHLFETFKTEINGKLSSLEDKITQKVDKYVHEMMTSLTEKVNDKFEQADKQREKERSEVDRHVLGVRKTLLSEKQTIRNMNNKFADQAMRNITKTLQVEAQNIKNITNAFDIRIEDAEQTLANISRTNELRLGGVEKKMFAFENASWKGEQGDPGPPGPSGPSGIKGSKGEMGVGLKGQKGDRGYTGSAGSKGQKGSPESRYSVYFSVSLKNDAVLSQNTIVKFDHILNNKGDGYSSTTGMFTAPNSGVYLFLFFAEPGKDKYDIALLRLYVHGKFSAYTIQEARDDLHDTVGGQAYSTYMSAGDQAWIETGELAKSTGKHNLENYGTTFTGILIN